MAAVRLSCLARNGRSPGEESLTAAIAVQAIEAQPAFGQIKPMRGWVLACAEQHSADVPATIGSHKKRRIPDQEKASLACRTAAPLRPNRQTPAHALVTTALQSIEEIIRLNRCKQEERDIAISPSASWRPKDDRRGSSNAGGHRPIR
jgi:uncharacterized protein (DUF3084 family)